MTSEVFTTPFMYWVGMNTPPTASEAEAAEFSQFYSEVHVPEVLAENPGFIRATRYELLQPDPRGDFGPRWLAMYELEDEAAARVYTERNDGPPEGRPTYTSGPAAWAGAEMMWRMIWHRLAQHGTTTEPPHSIYLVGMNVPPDTDAAGLAEFNEFYTDIHVPEVMAYRDFHRATRFELHREFRHPEPGCPQFCALYEADEASTVAQQQQPNAPTTDRSPLSSGPPTWEQHDTLWRLLYRRIDL